MDTVKQESEHVEPDRAILAERRAEARRQLKIGKRALHMAVLMCGLYPHDPEVLSDRIQKWLPLSVMRQWLESVWALAALNVLMNTPGTEWAWVLGLRHGALVEGIKSSMGKPAFQRAPESVQLLLAAYLGIYDTPCRGDIVIPTLRQAVAAHRAPAFADFGATYTPIMDRMITRMLCVTLGIREDEFISYETFMAPQREACPSDDLTDLEHAYLRHPKMVETPRTRAAWDYIGLLDLSYPTPKDELALVVYTGVNLTGVIAELDANRYRDATREGDLHPRPHPQPFRFDGPRSKEDVSKDAFEKGGES
jgi:hypothetical protein